MTYNSLTEEQAGKLMKLSRAKLVEQIDQLTTEKNQVESQTIPAIFELIREEASMLGHDLAWLSNRIIELGQTTRKAYDKFVRSREVELFPLTPLIQPAVLTKEGDIYNFDY